jgi:hypothetical protein
MAEEVSRHICIVHFLPLEKYPPAVNFLRYIADNADSNTIIHVLTMHPGQDKETVEISNIHIHWLITWSDNISRRQRLGFYLRFNWLSTRFLASHKPQVVLYYETLSAGGPCLYKLLFPYRCRLFIHYHEYVSPEEYKNGMVVNRSLHKLEKLVYHKAEWISHTNEKRMQLFLHDLNIKKKLSTYLLPNYPPANWHGIALQVKRNDNEQIGFVYVGALSMNTMFTKEMALFVAGNTGKCYWDIYSDNHESEALLFLKELRATNIRFKGSVNYGDLPRILPQYDIGVILYKGDTANYEYNAPNKFFEYLTAGLSVWFPPGMKGMKPYEQLVSKPKVQCIDFENIGLPPGSEAFRVAQLPAQLYVAEKIYGRLWKQMQEKIDIA